MTRYPDEQTRDEAANYEYWAGRLSGNVLAVPTNLLPGEHLRDAILRATNANGLRGTARVLSLAAPRSFRRLEAFKSTVDGDEIRRVVEVLGIRPDAERVEELLEGGSRGRAYVSFFGHAVRRSHIASHRRVSPMALRQSIHQRAVWSLKPLSFDPGTRETLLSACPVCRSLLGWGRTVGINYCETCPFRTVDLRDFPQSLVEPTDEEALRFVGDIVNPEVSDADFARWKPARTASRSDLFQLVARIAVACRLPKDASGGSQGAEIAPREIERAGRAVLGWPASFTQLVKNLEGEGGPERSSSPLWRLQSDPTISPELRRQIRNVHHAEQNRTVVEGSATTGTNIGTATARDMERHLQGPRAEIQRLLRVRPLGHGANELDVRTKVLRTVPEVSQASELLGVTVGDVWEIHSAGLIPELGIALTSNGLAAASMDQGIDLIRRLGSARDCRRNSLTLSLGSLRFALDVALAAGWSDILRAVFDGTLAVRLGPVSGRGTVHDLYVEHPQDFEQLLRSLPGRSEMADGALTQKELAMIMGKSRSTAAHIVQAIGLNGTLTFRSLRAFRRQWVTGFELTTLLNLRGHCVESALSSLHSSDLTKIKAKGMTLWLREPALAYCGL